MTYEVLIAGLKPRLKEKNIEWREYWLEGKYNFEFCTHPPNPKWTDYESWGIEYREEENEMDLFIFQGDGEVSYHFSDCGIDEVPTTAAWKRMNELIQECTVLPRMK